MHLCPGCEQPVPYEGRGRPRHWHRECKKAYRAQQRAGRKDEIAAVKRAWYLRNRERLVERQRLYREASRERELAELYALAEQGRL